ncbi:hypothetical protein ABT56_11365 [Photobacterium aquae]|uniref:Uncharacterized protein n=1 Tax=Photobacterium aquae TaxID=1195763 RepID=A0A0J1JTE4_9GAMM|nr:hypothetical protein [Photobacterium aquae]KLV05557.1 hypothetical protein ABT56_11365 [Photobacterium aquae]
MKTFLLAAAVWVASMPAVAAADAAPVSFQSIPEVMVQFEQAPQFRKKAVTYGRLPHKVELGTVMPTYVAGSDGKPKLETENTITETVVIARNPLPVSGAVFNEWLVPQDKWVETYGELPSFNTFMPFKRLKMIKAIPITEDVLTLLGSTDGETAVIAVDWNKEGMTVYKDGYLADGGYGIAPDEMQKTYERVVE